MNNGETLRNLPKITMSKTAVDTISGRQRLLQALSALQHRNYRLYWFGQLSSVLAQNMEGVAQSWLVLELTDSPLLLGLTGLTFAAPTIALTLVGGVIADRADRRRIMILSHSASASMFFLLGTLIIIERVALWHVMSLTFLSAACAPSTGRAEWHCCRKWFPRKIFQTPSPSAAQFGSSTVFSARRSPAC